VRIAADGRVFVAQKNGEILVYSDLDDPTPALFADLREEVYDHRDRGLLGLALDPDFEARPYVDRSAEFGPAPLSRRYSAASRVCQVGSSGLS